MSMLPVDGRVVFENPRGFIALEGLNGAGKTTLQRALIQSLQERGIPAVATREPGATPLGAQLRQILLDNKNDKPCALAEVMLFAADRAQHVNKVIRPALAAGSAVISDRYLYSTLAFQGGGREVGSAEIEQVNMIAVGGLLPDLVILLDIDPALGLRRNREQTQAQGQRDRDGFEAETLEFHRRIRQAFIDMAQRRPEMFIMVDASRSAQEVYADVLPIFSRWADALQHRRT